MNLKKQLFTQWEARNIQPHFVPTPKTLVKKYMFYQRRFFQCLSNLCHFPSALKTILQQNSSLCHWVCSGLIALWQLLRACSAQAM